MAAAFPAHPLRRLLIAVCLMAAVAAAVVLARQPAAADAAATVPAGEVDPSKATEPVSLTGKAFQTPSGRLACFADPQQHPVPLTCEVRLQDGDTHLPAVEGAKEPKICRTDFHSEWGGSVTLQPAGKARPGCPSGVMVPYRSPKVLPYDTRWKRGKYVCLSRTDALRCSTLSGAHGFRLDKDLMRVW
jgi:Ni/Co efflux regulator RcnB